MTYRGRGVFHSTAFQTDQSSVSLLLIIHTLLVGPRHPFAFVNVHLVQNL